MKTYRKSDQEYYDAYDKHTIQYLKQIEEQEAKAPPQEITIDGEVRILPKLFATSKFWHKGILRARNRESSVRESVQEDENKDRLIATHKVPECGKCNVCGARMVSAGHAFDLKGYELLFLFDCPKGTHKSRKIISPYGSVITFPESTCKKCGGELVCTTEESPTRFAIIDTCSVCGNVEIMECNRTPETAIKEEERQKYCNQFIGKRTFLEDLEAAANLAKRFKLKEAEEAEKQHYEVEKIEKLTIPKLKERLVEASQKSGYIEFGMEKPNMGKNVIIEFNVQDPTDRTSKESEKTLRKAFEELLLNTNWRLQSSSVSYRMGYLTGKLKGCEDDEGLLNLAKEIREKLDKKKK